MRKIIFILTLLVNQSLELKSQDYISSLIEDAKTDLANFENAIGLNEKRTVILDSLSFRCFNYNEKGNEDPELIIWYIKHNQIYFCSQLYF